MPYAVKKANNVSSSNISRLVSTFIGRWDPTVVREKAPAFIHIPKTGGTYLMQLESDQQPVLRGIKSFGHSYVIDQEGELNPIYLNHAPQLALSSVVPRETADACFMVSTVRNIFSWLVSYAAHAGGWNPRYNDPSHYDYANANKGLDYLVKVIAHRDQVWPCRKFIHCQIFSSGGDLMADQINRQESLDDDLAQMAARLNMAYRRKPPERVSGHKDYRRYYTDELVEIVSKTWSRELRLFGYGFDEFDPTKAVIAGETSRQQKESIKYNWKLDNLTIGGQEIPRR